MKLVLTILILILLQNNYQYKDNIPTKYGIIHYVELNKHKIVREFEQVIGENLFSYNIIVDDLRDYCDYDSLEAGRYYPEDDIIITNELKYIDYELQFIPKSKQKQYVDNNKFVKAVIIHELTHLYINEIKLEMQSKGMHVHHDYLNINTVPKIRSNADFIEEGICEYVTCYMKQSVCNNNYKPQSIEEIIDPNNIYKIKYIYSRIYLTEFLNKVGLKQGILILLSNEPPLNTEILYPKLYFSRIGFNK